MHNWIHKIANISIRGKTFRNLFDYMPDSMYLKLKYRLRMGENLDLKNPKTYNEKIQWLKLHDRKSEYTNMVDKYAAKQIAADVLGEEFVIPTLGVWEDFDQIDFDQLPNQFVLKCTHDSGGLVICRDKTLLDYDSAKKKITDSLERNYYFHAREWPYKNVPPRILAEKYMEDENEAKGLTDYKFFCFHGKPKMIYVSQGLEDHTTASISFYDLEGNKMPFYRSDFKPMSDAFVFPVNFAELVEAAEKLAKHIDAPFVRVDLYSIMGKVYFSEITFSPCGGMIPFEPKEWDIILGEWIQLPQ